MMFSTGMRDVALFLHRMSGVSWNCHETARFSGADKGRALPALWQRVRLWDALATAGVLVQSHAGVAREPAGAGRTLSLSGVPGG
jgi:hypothetical protein